MYFSVSGILGDQVNGAQCPSEALLETLWRTVAGQVAVLKPSRGRGTPILDWLYIGKELTNGKRRITRTRGSTKIYSDAVCRYNMKSR